MADRESFFIDDLPILVFECRRPNPDRMEDPDGVPAEPINAFAKYYSTTDGTLIEVNGSDTIPLGSIGDALWMEEMDDLLDRGAFLHVHIPDEVTELEGNYTLYLTTVYDDGLKITHDQKITISGYR